MKRRERERRGGEMREKGRGRRKSVRPMPQYSMLLRSGHTYYRWGPEDYDPDAGSPPPQCRLDQFKKFDEPDHDKDATAA